MQHRSLGRFVKPYRAPLGVAAALTVVRAAFDLASPWPLKLVVDNVVGGQALEGWMAGLGGLSAGALTTVAAAAVVALAAASSVVGYLTNYLMGSAAERIGADLRCAAFESLQRRSLRFHDQNRTGDLVSRLTSDVPRVQDVLVAPFQTLLPELLALVSMLAVLFVLDPLLALAALAVIPVLACQIIASRSRITAAEREVRSRNGGLAARATEVIRHVRAVQAFGREADEENRFRRESASATESAITALDVQARYGPTSDVILALGSGLILYLGVMRVTSGHLTLGTLLVVLSYVSAFYAPVRSLTKLTRVLAKGAASRERLQEIFAADARAADDPAAVPAPPGVSSLAFERVTFGYRADLPVLQRVSLELRAGETVCIVGATGAGKSTLLSLLLRLYEPDDGAVTLGGVDLRRFTLDSIRDRIAFVPQDTWILEGTIAENIRFGRPQATDEQVRHAGELALVDEFAARFPAGYDTAVGESGTFLSGGQRRRIALARALVRNASILLLDEPTSGLDAQSEATVVEALARLARTCTAVIVTHRLGLTALAQRVVVLDGGRVVEQGTPTVLLGAGGAFARLWAQQMSATRLPIAQVSAVRDRDDASELRTAGSAR